MRLLLDSANLDDIRRFSKSSAIFGVTTNPSLVAKETKKDYNSLLKEIAECIGPRLHHGHITRHLSVEVTTLDPDEMIKQATALYDSLSKYADIFIKIPVMPETLRVITTLTTAQVKVNATACMTAMQAKMAADAGAHIVSFFYNRMKDYAKVVNPLNVVAPTILTPQDEIQKFKNFKLNHPKSEVICGSIRTAADIYECFEAGADYVTTSAKLFDDILRHPKSVEAIDLFQKDIDSWLK